MTEIAKATGLGRQALSTALSENGNLTLETPTTMLSALGLELTGTTQGGLRASRVLSPSPP